MYLRDSLRSRIWNQEDLHHNNFEYQEHYKEFFDKFKSQSRKHQSQSSAIQSDGKATLFARNKNRTNTISTK